MGLGTASTAKPAPERILIHGAFYRLSQPPESKQR
jgi:hypothetical protein